MKNKLYVAGGVIVVAVVLFVALSVRQSKQIVIGAVIPQTGFGAYWGKPVLDGIALAKEDIAAEYGPDAVKIVVEDSQSAPAVSVSAAQKLLSVDHADAIYTEFSGPASAISPIVKSANKTLIYSAFNERILDDNGYAVKTFINHEIACQNFAEKYLDTSKRIIIVSVIPDAGPYCMRGLEKVVPASNIKDVEGFTGTDFRTLLLQNKSFGADYMIPLMYEDGAYALFKQRAELGIQTKIFCYKEDCMTEKNLTSLPASYTKGNMYFSVPIDPAFEARVKSLYPDVTDGDTQAIANAYQSVMLLAKGLSQCSDRSGSCVGQAISSITNPKYFAYRGGHMIGRMLASDVVMDEVK